MRRIAIWVSSIILLGVTSCSTRQAAPTTAAVTPEMHTLVPTVASTGTAEMGCSVIGGQPTHAASQGMPLVTASNYIRGPEKAAVTLLAYCDFQSAQCELFNRVQDQLEKEHPNDLRVVLRPFPVPTSVVAALDKSEISAQAAIAAGNQGKFWAMRDLLHTQYNAWTALSADGFEKWVTGQATGLGLDKAKFSKDL